MQKAVLGILGYGTDLFRKSEYQRYGYRAAQIAGSSSGVFGYKVDLVIPSGGFTNPKDLTLSEAAALSLFLKQWGIKTEILLDEQSYTTRDNVASIFRLASEQRSQKEHIVVLFCRAEWTLKVMNLAGGLSRGFEWRVETFDLGSHDEIKKQILGTVLSCVSFFDQLHKKLRRLKIFLG